MNNYKSIYTTWKKLPSILKKTTSNLKIKIVDPENVVLDSSLIKGSLGYLVRNYTGKYLFDFTPSDFSTAKYTNNSISLFFNCENLSGICKLPNIITYASNMFYSCTELTSIDTSGFTNVTNAYSMFKYCAKLKSIDTSKFTNVKDAGSMFESCINLKDINMLFGKNLKNFKRYDDMFEGCYKIF